MQETRQAPFINPALFTDTWTFAGVFSSGEHSSGPYSVEINLSRTCDHLPSGIIRGTMADFHRLERFFRHARAPQRLVSASAADGRGQFVAENVIIRSIKIRHYPPDEADTIHQIIGRFDIVDVTITHALPLRQSESRRVTFYLAGPSQQWVTHRLRRVSFDGNTTTEHGREERVLAGISDIKCSVQAHFWYRASYDNGREKAIAYQQDYPHRRFMVEAETVSFIIEDMGERSDEEFMTRAIEVMDAAADLRNPLIFRQPDIARSSALPYKMGGSSWK